MKIRFRFTKDNELCYVGHLDMMRFFQKAIRRAGIDIAYSQGFNPHQILTFASPLGLGITSEGEYFDATLNSCDNPHLLIGALNSVLTEGVRVTGACILPDEGNFNAMASLKACEYRINFDGSFFKNFDLEKLWSNFINNEEIIITKQTKRNTVDVDIKPLIHDFCWKENILTVILSAGSDETIKVTSLLDAFFNFSGISISGEDAFMSGALRVCRIDQYTIIDNKYVSLGSVGELL